MKTDKIIQELCRLAETKTWDGKTTDEALFNAIEGMERLWEQKQADQRRIAMVHANRKQPRICC
jgi:hypothetical protein